MEQHAHGWPEHVGPDHRVKQAPDHRWAAPAGQCRHARLVFADVLAVGVHARVLRVAAEPLHGHVQVLGKVDVVGVEKRQELARRRVERRVARSRLAAVILPNHPDARVADAVCDRARSVGRAVIDDDQFPIGEGLRDEAVDRAPDKTFRIERGHHDAHAAWPQVGWPRCTLRLFVRHAFSLLHLSPPGVHEVDRLLPASRRDGRACAATSA